MADPDTSRLPSGCKTWLDAAVQTLAGFHPTLRQSADGCRQASAELSALLTAAERAKGLEEENARLRAALRGLLDTGWHRDYGYMDPACDAPNGGECSCGLTNAKESARSALEAGK